MAEAALYGNKQEPAFPYEAIAKHLVWVPEYIEALTLKRGRNLNDSSFHIALINTFLVFIRARTSTLQLNCFEKICRKFLNRLNRTLLSLPESLHAKHHEIEIVRRFNGRHIFITCKQSPRFNWNRELTHREIGLNLDFAAPGHMGPHDSRIVISTFEVHQTMHSRIMDEVVLRDLVPNVDSLMKFIQSRTSLFNSCMRQLNLPYSFESVLDFDDKRSEVRTAVRTLQTPPSAEWWAEHYIAFGRTPYDKAFCSRNSRFAHYWEVLCILYEFFVPEKLPSSPLIPPVEFSEEVEQLFDLVYTTIEGHEDKVSLSLPSPKEFERQIAGRLRFLIVEPPSVPAAIRIFRRSDLDCLLDGLRETLRMKTTERWKLRAPLMHNNGVTDVGAFGHVLLRLPTPQASFISSVRDFFISRYE